MKCPNNDTVQQTGQEGDCVFCDHTTGKGGTPWPEGGVVCPCCIPLGIRWRQTKEQEASPTGRLHRNEPEMQNAPPC